MAVQQQPVELNKFTAGLITDASPLTSVENSSLEEVNMVLNLDGSRNRRFGMDYEDDHEFFNSGITTGAAVNLGITSYRWDNAGGIPDKSILVVQMGNRLQFYNLTTDPVSAQFIVNNTITEVDTTRIFSYANIDGLLVVTSGSGDIKVYEYTEPDTITVSGKRLLVRDFWGVEDKDGSTDLLSANDVQFRPTTLTNNHLYNLRNQSFGISRIQGNNETLIDPITYFRDVSGAQYPSNSDTVNEALYPDANDPDNRTIERFFAFDLYRNAVGSSRAANGHYIIDVLERGPSRYANVLASQGRYPDLVSGGLTIAALNDDTTTGGATCICEFAGRVWYGGFTSDTVDGDEQSPKLTSYILFSQTVESPDDIYRCYQENDPTAKDANDILDTDGGFIKLNEAYNIIKLVNVGASLLVIATNGVWRVYGGDNGFTATSYIVDKVSDRGCSSPNSVVQVDNGVMFWSDGAIYHLTTDQFGSWVNNNISIGRIQKFYDSIPIDQRRLAVGSFDTLDRKVRWLYGGNTLSTGETKELVIDLQLAAYYTNTIKQSGAGVFPKVAGYYVGNIYRDENNTQKEVSYIILSSISPTAIYSFGKYKDVNFRDWYSLDDNGIDAEAYVVTSYISGGDFQRKKGVKYITVHLRRTETGYDVDMNPENASSCLMQARWSWANSAETGKWGREFQVYRYRRLHIPVDDTDPYDTGFSTITSRNKLRGDGKVLSLRFRTEPYKNLHLYGWSMILTATEDV